MIASGPSPIVATKTMAIAMRMPMSKRKVTAAALVSACSVSKTARFEDRRLRYPSGVEHKDVWIGCSGWSYDDWRAGAFYPPRLAARDRLQYYATQFDTVELNASFYRLPRRSTVEHWAAQAPEGFRFAVKVSRYLTHVVRLANTAEHLALLLERIEPLLSAHKLGPLLWQLPPTFRRDDDRLAAALEAMPRDFRHAIEFRHASWFTDEVMELLRRHRVALVLADRPEVHAFQTDAVTTDFAYVRFHYGSRGRRGNYSPAELDGWAGLLAKLSEKVEVWVFFNNDWEAFAPANARRLRDLLVAHRGSSVTA
jgi:uncharacterized protein YecE (DUF72 family)